MQAPTRAGQQVGWGARLDDGVVMGEAVEVVVEHGLPDDVQREAGEQVLHFHRLPSVCRLIQQLRAPRGAAESAATSRHLCP